MLIDKQYSASAQERIEVLKKVADGSGYKGCVVDVAGYVDGDGPVLETEVERRFEVRSLSDVRAYGFPVVYYGKGARAMMEKPTILRRVREAAGPELADEAERMLSDYLNANPDVAF